MVDPPFIENQMGQSEVKLWPLRHRPQGPLAPHIDAFAVCLSEQGFKRHSIAQQIRLIVKLNLWMKTQAVGMDLLADEHFDRFRRFRCLPRPRWWTIE